MTTRRPLVAVIGLGAMGGPMAHRIATAGFDLVVCDRNELVLAPFAECGATITQSARDCAIADVILVVVLSGAQVRDVVFGPDGIAAGLPAGRTPILAVMSTIAPDAMGELAQAVSSTPMRLIDAPISGGALRAAEGTLTLILGGEPSDIDDAAAVWDVLGTRRFHCGGVGSAQAVKLVNNVVADANAMITAEAYRLALELGLSLQDTIPVLEASTGRNYLSERPGEAVASYATWTQTRGTFAALTATMRKDVGLAVTAAARVPGDYPVMEQLAAALNAAGDHTYETWCAVGAAGA